MIQDGSSFALKKKLRDVFPGRFTTIEPAAIEIHATSSGFSDEVSSVQIAPDKEAELCVAATDLPVGMLPIRWVSSELCC